MKFGLLNHGRCTLTKAKELVHGAQAAEEYRYDTIMIDDHTCTSSKKSHNPGKANLDVTCSVRRKSDTRRCSGLVKGEFELLGEGSRWDMRGSYLDDSLRMIKELFSHNPTSYNSLFSISIMVFFCQSRTNRYRFGWAECLMPP